MKTRIKLQLTIDRTSIFVGCNPNYQQQQLLLLTYSNRWHKREADQSTTTTIVGKARAVVYLVYYLSSLSYNLLKKKG